MLQNSCLHLTVLTLLHSEGPKLHRVSALPSAKGSTLSLHYTEMSLHYFSAEPKYSDPLIGAPASYQQRLIELGALEGDTVRWERTKRLKKKKQDRDS